MIAVDIAEHIRAVVDVAPPLPEIVVEMLTAPAPREEVVDHDKAA